MAESAAVSITTVRTHIQRIFRKTGTHRQAELVRLLVAVVA
nr:LuxR C-terminal-related transcriptional regulator [Mycobacterium sp. 94-17]